MDEIRVQLPGSNVIIDYASEQERADSLRLAAARQQIAVEGVFAPAWQEITGYDREMAALEARNWLRAAARAGLYPCGDHAEWLCDRCSTVHPRNHGDGFTIRCPDCRSYMVPSSPGLRERERLRAEIAELRKAVSGG